MTEYAVFDGQFEIRARGGARILSGRFPYERTATIRSSGRVRKERFKSGSLGWQVREFQKLQGELAEMVSSEMNAAVKAARIEALEDALERRNTHFLVGHDYDKAIADMQTGNLAIKHTREAVEIEATLPAEGAMPSWVKDAVLAVEGGQLRGISPRFEVPAGKGSQQIIPEPGNPGVAIREISDAVAFEYSLVARPAYSGTNVSAREDDLFLVPEENRGRRRWL